MPGCGPNMTNWQRLWQRSSQCSEVFPTRLLFFSPQFATIGHTLPDCREEVASSNYGLLVRVSAAYIPQRHGELCNPPVAASGSVDVLLRCGTPPQQHDAMKTQVGLSLPDFAVSDDAKHRKRHQPGAKSEQQPQQCAALTGWTCARVVLRWQVRPHRKQRPEAEGGNGQDHGCSAEFLRCRRSHSHFEGVIRFVISQNSINNMQ